MTNPEVLAIDQDSLGVEGHRAWQEGPLEAWMKPVADGGRASGYSNERVRTAPYAAARLGAGHSAQVGACGRGGTSGTLRRNVPSRRRRDGAALLKVQPQNGK